MTPDGLIIKPTYKIAKLHFDIKKATLSSGIILQNGRQKLTLIRLDFFWKWKCYHKIIVLINGKTMDIKNSFVYKDEKLTRTGTLKVARPNSCRVI